MTKSKPRGVNNFNTTTHPLTFLLIPLLPLYLSLLSIMFSSPAPRATPRKSVFRGRGDTASVSRGTPSIASASEREPLTPSHRSSRLNALKRAASPTSTAGETARTARYEEGGERVFLAKDQRGEIYSLGGLPREVQQIVKNSGRSCYWPYGWVREGC